LRFTRAFWGLVAFPFLLAGLTIPVAAQTPSDAECELHVWGGGYPNRVLKSNAFVKVMVEQADPNDPLSNAFLYNPKNRLQAWSDASLSKLFPGAGSVKIIRHDSVIDFEKVNLKKLAGRLSESSASCYGDVVIANIYGIFPNPDFQGVLVDAIDGGNRLVMDIWMQQNREASSKPFVFRKKNDAPLLSFHAERPLFAASMADASEKILVAFGEVAAKKKSGKK
jgi:hypothetical protein